MSDMTINFLITIGGPIVGIILGILICAFFDIEIFEVQGLIIFGLMILPIMIGTMHYDYVIEPKKEAHVWNNGYHLNCGGKYDFINATEYKYGIKYVYECEKCSKVLVRDNI